MPILAILLIAASALMHAAWNLICKSRHPSAACFLVATTATILVTLPLTLYYLPQVSRIPKTVWCFLLLTGIVQAVYYAALGNAYRLNDISVAYPLAKSFPVVLVPIVTMIFGLGSHLGPGVLSGMVLVCVGCIVLPMPSFRHLALRNYWNRGFFYIAAVALATTGYTVIDSEGMRHFRAAGIVGTLPTALLYLVWENILIEIFLIPLVWCRTRERRMLTLLIFSGEFRYPMLSGVICSTSYFLVLLAMLLASNVSYIAAFRQLSIPLGAVAGILLLKERSTVPKLLGIFLIFLGLLLVGLWK